MGSAGKKLRTRMDIGKDIQSCLDDLNNMTHQIYPREESPDMLMLDLFLAHLKTMRSCQKNMGLSYRCFELRRDTWNE